MFYQFCSLFISRNRPLSKTQSVIIIKAFGFERLGDNYVRHSNHGTTQIAFHGTGIWIKAYSSGYGESDFLKYPFTKNSLNIFIRENSG